MKAGVVTKEGLRCWPFSPTSLLRPHHLVCALLDCMLQYRESCQIAHNVHRAHYPHRAEHFHRQLARAVMNGRVGASKKELQLRAIRMVRQERHSLRSFFGSRKQCCPCGYNMCARVAALLEDGVRRANSKRQRREGGLPAPAAPAYCGKSCCNHSGVQPVLARCHLMVWWPHSLQLLPSSTRRISSAVVCTQT